MSSPLLYVKSGSNHYFRPREESKAGSSIPVLKIGSQGVTVVSGSEFPTDNVISIAGILGTINLKLGKYLVLAIKGEQIGKILNHNLYKVTKYEIITLRKDDTSDTFNEESNYLRLLKDHLDAAPLIYSYSFDVTNSLQRQSGPKDLGTIDDRFFWNKFLSSDLLSLFQQNNSISPFIFPVVYGYLGITQSTLNNTKIEFVILTRRSRFRAGTRYFRRGIDEFGNVANFNETEQILIVNNKEIYSFLQTRGSVPIYWTEINNLKYKPLIKVGKNFNKSIKASEKHFEEQKKYYGKNYLVNLVNNKGHELPIKESYKKVIESLNDSKIQYIYFDFHHECRNMKWHRVMILVDTLKKLGLSFNDFYHAKVLPDGSFNVIQTQNSVVRTNCMDCLDRTNVVQSTLGRVVLTQQLFSAGVFKEDEILQTHESFEFTFRNFWADNADVVSNSYSGTGALKTDFTRTGKRTKAGALKDLQNSITRYIKNNFKDGSRQDGYDLILGNFKPLDYTKSFALVDYRPLKVQSVPYFAISALFLFLFTLIFSKGILKYFPLTASFALLGFSLFHMIANGFQYVNWPKLVPLEFLEKQNVIEDDKLVGLSFKESESFEKYKG